jgi:4-amino-4-deoxy-L-arabinose transferase-like glycosyltransferase
LWDGLLVIFIIKKAAYWHLIKSMQKNIIVVFGALLLVYCIGLGIDIMDIDASQYAEMSREMSNTNSYLQVFELGKDYLDKPAFLFWISSLSMKLFGVNNFAYKLPSLLFALAALYFTFKFALLYYKKEIAFIAVLVLASCQAFFLITNDVRTDTILMSWVILSIWQLATWYKTNKFINLIVGFVAIAFGMMTKGPIAIIVPVLSFGSHLLVTRNFKNIFRWEYIVGLLIVAILLIPMSYGLYHQFDMQPTKIVNNGTGVSGLRFFFWTQSFGRITGESIWNNGATIFFLFQNLLWAFLPWIVIFIIALFDEIKSILQQKFKLSANTEWICMGGFVLTYIALGSSKYQLPHYIFVVLPFAAIITAKFLYKLATQKNYENIKSILEKSHFVIFLLLWIMVMGLLYYCFPAALWIKILAAIFLAGYFFIFLQKSIHFYILKISLYTIIGINLFLSLSVYPSLLKYQAGSNIGSFITKNNIPTNNMFLYKLNIPHAIHFTVKAIIPHKDNTDKLTSGALLITTKDKLVELDEKKIVYEIIYSMNDFSVTMLTLKFLNPKTRSEVTTPYVLVRLK